MPGLLKGKIWWNYVKLLRLARVREIEAKKLQELLEMTDRAFYEFVRYIIEQGWAEKVRKADGVYIRLLDPTPEMVNNLPWKRAKKEGVPVVVR